MVPQATSTGSLLELAILVTRELEVSQLALQETSRSCCSQDSVMVVTLHGINHSLSRRRRRKKKRGRGRRRRRRMMMMMMRRRRVRT